MAVLPLLLDADPSQSCRWIENFLHHHLFHEAAFLAERLPAFPEVEGGRVLELWAEALLSAGEPSRVRHQLQGFHSSRSLSPRVLYLLALACIRLEHYDEAEVALLAGNIDLLEKWRNGQMQPLEHVVEGAAGAYQLGRAAEGMGRKHQALDCYAACLKQCPYMWGAFERFSWLSLCRQDSRPGQSPRGLCGCCPESVQQGIDSIVRCLCCNSRGRHRSPGVDTSCSTQEKAQSEFREAPKAKGQRLESQWLRTSCQLTAAGSGQSDLAVENARDFLTKKGEGQKLAELYRCFFNGADLTADRVQDLLRLQRPCVRMPDITLLSMLKWRGAHEASAASWQIVLCSLDFFLASVLRLPLADGSPSPGPKAAGCSTSD